MLLDNIPPPPREPCVHVSYKAVCVYVNHIFIGDPHTLATRQKKTPGMFSLHLAIGWERRELREAQYFVLEPGWSAHDILVLSRSALSSKGS